MVCGHEDPVNGRRQGHGHGDPVDENKVIFGANLIPINVTGVGPVRPSLV